MNGRSLFARCARAVVGTGLIAGCNLSHYGSPDESQIPLVVELHLGLPTPVIPLGTSARVSVTAFNAAGERVEPVTGIRFRSTNPRAIRVDSNGVTTGIFTFASLASGYVVGSVNGGGATVADSVFVIIRAPRFDYAALMLPEWVAPDPARSDAVGVAYMSRDSDRFMFTLAWSGLSGPPTGVHLHGSAGDGEVASVIVSLAGAVTEAGTLTGSFSVPEIRAAMGQPGISLDSLGILIGEGLVYADVHTGSFPEGEMRGVINGPFVVDATARAGKAGRTNR